MVGIDQYLKKSCRCKCDTICYDITTMLFTSMISGNHCPGFDYVCINKCKSFVINRLYFELKIEDFIILYYSNIKKQMYYEVHFY